MLSILTCDVSKGIRKVNPKPNEAVLITGAGTIGLLTVFMLKALGVQTIDVVEPRAGRRAMALQLGARMAMPSQEITKGSEIYPVAFECSSRDAAFELLQGKMQREGRICILSDGNIEPLTPRACAISRCFHPVVSNPKRACVAISAFRCCSYRYVLHACHLSLGEDHSERSLPERNPLW